MSPQEFNDRFDVLFNNITSNQAPGLNAYEKSLFLTKGQDEILKNYFNPKSNKLGEGFDDNQKRQIDFSAITKVASVQGSSMSVGSSLFDMRSNTKSVSLPDDIMMIVNEKATVTRANKTVLLTVVPISYNEYDRLMSKPYKRPVQYQAWRLIVNDSGNKGDIIIGPNDVLTDYQVRYIKRPNPIIVDNLDGLTINGVGDVSECELDPILHEEILQRAVELAKIAWTATGLDNMQPMLLAGQRSE